MAQLTTRGVLLAVIVTAACGGSTSPIEPTTEPSSAAPEPPPAPPAPVPPVPPVPPAPDAPNTIEPGEYTLTLIADNACRPLGKATSSDLPSELRRRTYDATITRYSTPSSGYDVDVRGEFLSPFGFGLVVSGTTLSFEIDGPPFFERFPSFSYLEITGQGTTTVDASTVSSIAFPFAAVFEYCVLNSAMRQQNNCYTTPADQVITYSVCSSSNHQMILKHK